VKKLTGDFDNGLGAVLIGEHGLASFLSKKSREGISGLFQQYRSISAAEFSDRHGRTCFNTGRQGTQPLRILLIDGIAVAIEGKRGARIPNKPTPRPGAVASATGHFRTNAMQRARLPREEQFPYNFHRDRLPGCRERIPECGGGSSSR
jgi:hypothetical protein